MNIRKIKLDLIKEKAATCTKCPELSGRTQSVFGKGNINTKLIIIGEAPGRYEDEKGEPFVGDSGILLTNILTAHGIAREDTYITNIIKCRPPQNRTPLPNEISNCNNYIKLEIEIINPKFILLLGKTATEAILNMPFGSSKGKIFNIDGKTLLSTYHPSFLLRTPEAKKDVSTHLRPFIDAIISDN